MLPYQHALQHLGGLKDEEIILHVGENSWMVVVKNTNEQFRFGRGWRKFVQDNQLVRNDACLFQIFENAAIYEVKIFKA